MNDTIEIRPLAEEDLERLGEIRRFAFLDTSDAADPEIRRHRLDWLRYRTGAFVDGVLGATASWLPFHMYRFGEPRPVWGLASVSTAAEYRRRGLVRRLLAEGLERLRAEGAAWCLEYPFDPRYYATYGWQTVENGTARLVPIDHFPSENPPRFGSFGLDDADEAREIYASWAANYSFAMVRDEAVRPHWEWLLEGPVWNRKKRFAHRTDEAYLVSEIVRREGEQHLVVHDWAYATPDGRRDVLSFIATLRGQVDRVKLQMHAGDPLTNVWSNFAVNHDERLQARIVDVERAFADLPIDASGEIRFAVTDAFLPSNDGVYRLRAADGSIEATRRSTDPSDEADARATIGGLSRLLAGASSASLLARVGALDANADAVRLLDRLEIPTSYMSWADYF